MAPGPPEPPDEPALTRNGPGNNCPDLAVGGG